MVRLAANRFGSFLAGSRWERKAVRSHWFSAFVAEWIDQHRCERCHLPDQFDRFWETSRKRLTRKREMHTFFLHFGCCGVEQPGSSSGS